MASNATFARIAALAGDPARAGMLHALMDGRALTASELAERGGHHGADRQQPSRPHDGGRAADASRSRAGTATTGWPRPTWRT